MDSQKVTIVNGKCFLSPDVTAWGVQEDSIQQIFSISGKDNVGIVTEMDNYYLAKTGGDLLVLDALPNVPREALSHFCWRPLSPAEFAYTCGNGLIIYNTIDKKYSSLAPVNILAEDIEHFWAWDLNKRQFLLGLSPTPYFKILSCPKQQYNDENDVNTFRGIIDTVAKYGPPNDANPASRKEIRFLGQWSIREGLMFFGDESSVFAFNKAFTRQEHPLCQAINAVKPGWVIDAVIHPELPFAILDMSTKDDSSVLLVVRWQLKDEKERIVPLSLQLLLALSHQPPYCASNFQLSPDGKWFVLSYDSDPSRHSVFYAFPIEPENPMFLGKPICLGGCIHNNLEFKSNAWLDGPACFAVADAISVYKWDLNAVHPTSTVSTAGK